jgi:hypothetical protein
MKPRGYAKKKAEKRARLKSFLKSRFSVVAEAEAKMDWTADPNFDASLALPELPPWYAQYRDSTLWREIELNERRRLGSTCHDCRKFRRINIFHTDANRIHPHDPTAIIGLCDTCAQKRQNISHRIIKLRALHGKTYLRHPDFRD